MNPTGAPRANTPQMQKNDTPRAGQRRAVGTPGSPAGGAAPNAAPSGGLSSLFPRLFGSKPSSSRSSSSSDPTRRHGETIERKTSHRSPKSRFGALPPPEESRAVPATPFDLDEAINVLQQDNAPDAELAESAKSIGAYIAGLYSEHDDIFGSPGEPRPTLEPKQVANLYEKAVYLAGDRSASSTFLRTSTLRLLAVLLATFPPPRTPIDPTTLPLPPGIHARSIYRVIVTKSTLVDVDKIFVQIEALKALTKNGVAVEQCPGVVGWLIQSLQSLTDDWLAWCRGQDRGDILHPQHHLLGPTEPSTPAETATAIIELLHNILLHHVILFTPDDLTRILQPILDFLWMGIAGCSTAVEEKQPVFSPSISPTITRRGSPTSTALNSPSQSVIGGALGLEPAVRSSMSRPRNTTVSASGTPVLGRHSRMVSSPSVASPPVVGSPAFRSPSPQGILRVPRWSKVLLPFCNLVEYLISNAALEEGIFEKIIALLCLAFGQDHDDMLPDEAWDAAHQLLAAILGSRRGRRGELAIREILDGKVIAIPSVQKLKMRAESRKMTRGAVAATRHLLRSSETPSSDFASVSLPSLVPSLRAATSSSRLPDPKQLNDRLRWQTVDYELLSLLQDHLFVIEQYTSDNSPVADDVWTEGDAACDLLKAIAPSLSDIKNSREIANYDFEAHPLAGLYNAIIHQLPMALGQLHTGKTSTPAFYHPAYIDLLLELSPYLDEDEASIIVEHYQRESLCLPPNSRWIQNIWKLITPFFSTNSTLAQARQKIAVLLFKDVYGYVEDMSDYRFELVERVIVPFLDKSLVDETEEFQKLALDVLASAAVAETLERDEERRQARQGMSTPDIQAEDNAPLPSQHAKDLAAGGSFHSIRRLIIRLASQAPCADENTTASLTSPPMPTTIGADLTHVSGEIRRSRSGKAAASARASLSLSPTLKNAEFPTLTTVASQLEHTPPMQAETATIPAKPHAECKSINASRALIAIFVRLAFAPAESLDSRATRTPASSRCITIFRDLLGLLYPMNEAAASSTAVKALPARCPRARLTILQFLSRLRADGKHRIFFRHNIDAVIMPFADTLHRTKEREAELRAATDAADARRIRVSANVGKSEPVAEERGRSIRVREDAPRSRSRSKQPAIIKGAADAISYNPLWCLPEEIDFEHPPDETPSEGMTTWDPAFPSLRDASAPLVEEVWLPVSEYIRVLNGILRGHDWELVSYVLCFLALQIRNKLFFHGSRATKEVRALADVLCEGVMGGGRPWEKRFSVPSFITRLKINAVAYQTITGLIAFNDVLSKEQNDIVIQALAAGLQGRREVAKPVIQALTLAIFELEHYLGRHLLAIVERMKDIISTTAIAVHILEFLITLGQHGSLFRNFTEDQYRLVFAVATGYISEHNARSEQPAGDKEEYTLSQQVIGLAYYSIYVWFMAIKLPQRHRYVSDITQRLLQARSKRAAVDEMAEVCFDWLARYTYGSADPRPATSFLSEMVMGDKKEQDPVKSQSWLLGGAIVTINTHARSGWATIKTTRPTGTTSIICKLENVPLLELGEANADLISLPAVFMADRSKKVEPAEVGERSGEQPPPEAQNETPAPLTEHQEDPILAGEDPVKKIFDVQSAPSPMQDFNRDSQHGYIWSGATPSQRRKDVVIEPSFLALQLLSSYPNGSLETPRGRLIPQEQRFIRILRGIENTPIIDTLKIAVLYVAPGQTTEKQILGNVDGSPLYLDFLSGLGRIIRLKGQVDVSVGGLDREGDEDGEYAYAWWDDLTQVIFHAPTMMPNLPLRDGETAETQGHNNKKRHVGNDYVKIVYNDHRQPFAFDTIKTAFNFVNIVIAPHSAVAPCTILSKPGDGDDGDFFTVTLQRAPGIPDFSAIGEGKVVSRRALPILVRQVAMLANDMAARFSYVRDAADMSEAEYITPWRSRLRAIGRLRSSLPTPEIADVTDPIAREEQLRDFTRNFSYIPQPEDK